MSDPDNLPEYESNPFTRVMGAPLSPAGYYDQLDAPVHHDESERAAPAHLRRHRVLRLFDLCIPTMRQVELAERIGMVIRQGYKGRDPSKGLHKAAFLATAAIVDRHRRGAPAVADRPVPLHSDAQFHGFAAIGDPGMGKTRGTDRILMHIDQVHDQQVGYFVRQLVYAKVQCPSDGSRGAFCQAVFSAFDKALGTNYLDDFGRSKVHTVGAMILGVQHICTLHALGVLVVDEIQHLANAKEGPEMLMNFLVTLVNTIGVPVVLIGTNKARRIVGRDFREARRASGLPTGAWERMPRHGGEFDSFLDELWRYQWTRVETELTVGIRDVIYRETQGIIDLIVKLFMLAQLRVISIVERQEEAEEDGANVPPITEELTEALFSRVAADEFGLVAPMIRALRDGRPDVLEEYPDLETFDRHVDAVFAKALGQNMDEFLHLRELNRRTAEREAKQAKDGLDPFRDSLRLRGFAPRKVDKLISAAKERVPSGDMFDMLRELEKLIETEKAAGEAPAKPKRPRKKPVDAKTREEGLGAIAGDGDPHEALSAAGVIRSPAEMEAA